MRITVIAIPAGLLLLVCGLTGPGRSAPVDCSHEVAALLKQEAELPRLDVASPADRPILCITLETVMAFAGRLKAHVGHCPNSSYASAAAAWEKTRADYAQRFTRNRCRRTLLNR